MAKILVIDDDAQFRRLVALALRPRGHEIWEASRARDAEAMLAQKRPDLLLIDGLLPDADGSRWIGERRKTLNAPFIFASAFWKGTRDARQLHADVKPTGFLHKPATAEEILREVERALGGPAPTCALSTADLQELEAMRVEYAAGLSSRIAQIRRGLEQLRLRPRDAVLFAETRRLVHELAGTAGSFGFDELSTIGAELEQALVAWKTKSEAGAWAGIAIKDRALAAWEQRCDEQMPCAGPRLRAVGGKP